MAYIITIALIIIVLMAIILLTNLNILVEYKKDLKDDVFVLSVFAYKGLIKYKYKIPAIDAKSKGISYKSVKKTRKNENGKGKKKHRGYVRYTSIIDSIEKYKVQYKMHKELISKIFQYLKCKMIINKLEFDLAIGTGNAMYTAIITGIAWSAAGIITSLIYSFFRIENKKLRDIESQSFLPDFLSGNGPNKNINIVPDFMGKKFKIDLYCIFKIRTVHIIIIGLMVLKSMITKKLGFIRIKKSIAG
jgi:hypothetical protein